MDKPQYSKELIEERKKSCDWYKDRYCMADTGEWGLVPCNGDCTYVKDYKDWLLNKQNMISREDLEHISIGLGEDYGGGVGSKLVLVLKGDI